MFGIVRLIYCLRYYWSINILPVLLTQIGGVPLEARINSPIDKVPLRTSSIESAGGNLKGTPGTDPGRRGQGAANHSQRADTTRCDVTSKWPPRSLSSSQIVSIAWLHDWHYISTYLLQGADMVKWLARSTPTLRFRVRSPSVTNIISMRVRWFGTHTL